MPFVFFLSFAKETKNTTNQANNNHACTSIDIWQIVHVGTFVECHLTASVHSLYSIAARFASVRFMEATLHTVRTLHLIYKMCVDWFFHVDTLYVRHTSTASNTVLVRM